MTDDDIALPPLPPPAIFGPHGTGTYFSAWTEKQVREEQRAAVLLDRQQRAVPTYGNIAERAAAGKDAGLWQAAPSAEPVGVAETIMGTAGALTMAAFHAKDAPAGTSLYTTPPDHREAMRQALEALEGVASAMPFPVAVKAIDALRKALEEKR